MITWLCARSQLSKDVFLAVSVEMLEMVRKLIDTAGIRFHCLDSVRLFLLTWCICAQYQHKYSTYQRERGKQGKKDVRGKQTSRKGSHFLLLLRPPLWQGQQTPGNKKRGQSPLFGLLSLLASLLQIMKMRQWPHSFHCIFKEGGQWHTLDTYK